MSNNEQTEHYGLDELSVIELIKYKLRYNKPLARRDRLYLYTVLSNRENAINTIKNPYGIFS